MSYNPNSNILSVGGVNINAFPAGFMRVTDEPHQLFYDPFDTSLDTVNRWSIPIAVGGGVVTTTGNGSLSLESGITASGYSYLNSQGVFVPTVPAWLGTSWAVQIESGATAGNNAVRFWGEGIVSGSVPFSTAPLGSTGNGYGFEIDINGVLQGVVYANGTRSAFSLAALQPTDGLMHRYICFYRTDRIYWYIDGLANTQLAGSASFTAPAIQSLPILVLALAHTTPPAASRVFNCTGMAVWDTGKNNVTLSDGAYPWRKITIKPSNYPALATDTALVVAISPSTPVTIGNKVITQNQTTNADQSVNELLLQANGALRAIAHLLADLVAISKGQTAPQLGDEADRLIGEYLDPRNNWTNLTN